MPKIGIIMTTLLLYLAVLVVLALLFPLAIIGLGIDLVAKARERGK